MVRQVKQETMTAAGTLVKSSAKKGKVYGHSKHTNQTPSITKEGQDR